jgi:hypothetical protein
LYTSDVACVAISRLGPAVEGYTEQDRDGERLIVPLFSATEFLADVLWEDGQEPAEWVPYRVKPSSVDHWFAGQEDLWHACNP